MHHLYQFDFRYDAVGNIVSEKTVPEIEPDFNLEMIYGAANRLASSGCVLRTSFSRFQLPTRQLVGCIS
jgi:hypothetical protein